MFITIWFWNMQGFRNFFNLVNEQERYLANSDVVLLCETSLNYNLENLPHFPVNFNFAQCLATKKQQAEVDIKEGYY